MPKREIERRSIDRPIKRVRQLQSRLDTLLSDARALRSEGLALTRNARTLTAALKGKRRQG